MVRFLKSAVVIRIIMRRRSDREVDSWNDEGT